MICCLVGVQWYTKAMPDRYSPRLSELTEEEYAKYVAESSASWNELLAIAPVVALLDESGTQQLTSERQSNL